MCELKPVPTTTKSDTTTKTSTTNSLIGPVTFGTRDTVTIGEDDVVTCSMKMTEGEIALIIARDIRQAVAESESKCAIRIVFQSGRYLKIKGSVFSTDTVNPKLMRIVDIMNNLI